jgi:hypothetical protein
MAADRWGAKSTQEERKLSPKQFEAAWQNSASKVLRGEALQTEAGNYFVRCGRLIGPGKWCLHRLGHSVSCSPNFANICDVPLPKDKRCVLTAGHKSKCMPVFPR